MCRRMMASILFIGLILVLTIQASAVQTGSIHVETTGGTVALYQVGQINGQDIRLLDVYGGGKLSEDDILSANLASWLNENVVNGQIKDTDVWGDVTFDGLEPGLYLLTQPSTPSGLEPFAPFLMVMPWDGYVWEIDVDLEILPQTGETSIPEVWIFGMLLSAVGIGICLYGRRGVAV